MAFPISAPFLHSLICTGAGTFWSHLPAAQHLPKTTKYNISLLALSKRIFLKVNKMQQTIGIRPSYRQASNGAILDLYQKTTAFAAARGHVWQTERKITSSCDWLFSEGGKSSIENLQCSSEFSGLDARGIIPLLSLSPASAFAEVRFGRECRAA